MRWIWLLFPLLVCCELDRAALEAPLAPEGPLPAGGRLHWLDPPRARLITLDVGDGALTCTRTPDRPRGLAAKGDEVWLLGETEAGPALLRHDPVTGARSTTPLPHPFDRVILDPRRDQGILLATPAGAALEGGPAILDPAKLAVVDGDEVTIVPIEAGGLATDAIFSPGSTSVAVLLQRGILFLDGADPTRNRLAHLELADGTSLEPREGRFTPDGSHFLVLAKGSGDLLVFSIRDTPDSFDVSINLLSAPGGAIERMILLDDELVAVSAGETVSVLHLEGDKTRTRSRTLAVRPAQIALHEGGALLFAGTATEREGVAMAAWDPHEDLLDQALLDGTLVDVRAIGGKNYILHRGEEGFALTSVAAKATGVDLRLRLHTFPLSGWPTALAPGPSEGSVLLSVHGGFAPEHPEEEVAAPNGTLVSLGDEGRAIATVDLDSAIVEVGVVGRSLFAVHPSPLGDLTVVPAGDVRRATAKRIEGIFATGLEACP